jgi:hypothetical protein
VRDLQKHLHKNLLNIVFNDADHSYNRLDNEGEPTGFAFTSVTTKLKEYQEPFDSVWYGKKADEWNKGYSLPNDKKTSHVEFSSKRFGEPMWTEDTVKKYWGLIAEMGQASGTIVHNYLENRFQGKVFPPTFPSFETEEDKRIFHTKYDQQMSNAKKFYKDYRHLTPVQLELMVFNNKYAGQVDGLFELDGKLILLDYKTDKEIQMSNKWQSFKAPLSHLEACNYNKYRLQTSVYKYMFEEQYDFKIDEIWIIHLSNRLPTYKKYVIKPLMEEAKLLVND